MSFALICFDWDGTLMDSQARIVDCLLAAFAEAGQPPPSRAAARFSSSCSMMSCMDRSPEIGRAHV